MNMMMMLIEKLKWLKTLTRVLFRLMSKSCRRVLRCKGKTFTAVNKVSFNVNPEECFALLGVNGAGKTTTFKMLTGELFADAGNAFVGGFEVNKQLSKGQDFNRLLSTVRRVI
jgi:ABC-type multidrug transport system ATPase subunit